MPLGEPGRKSRTNATAIALGGTRAGSAGRWRGVTLPLWLRPGLAAAIALEVERRRLFPWLAVLFGLGIVAYFAAETEPSLFPSAIACALFLVGAAALRRQLAPLAVCLALAALFAGFLAATVRSARVAAPVLAAPAFVTVDGRIEALDRTAYGARLIVRVADVAPAIERMPERIRVTQRGKADIVAGDGVRFRARLMPPSSAALPGGFDFEREAYFQQIGAVGTVAGALTRLESVPPLPVRARLTAAIDRARNALTERIIAVVGGSTGAIAAALITGKRGQIAESDNDDWRAAGIYHLVSISGLHMMLAAGLFFWSARLAFALIPPGMTRLPGKKIAAIVAMAGATAYNVFSGSEVATERALVMTLVMFGAILFDRPALAMRNLAISALAVMLMRPETVLGPSFQMSFGAVAALVAYGEAERRWHERASAAAHPASALLTHRLARLAIAFIMTSLIAGLATAPFQAFHFHRLNPFGILGNALAVPLCSFLVMPSALIGVLAYPFGLDAPVWTVMGQGIAAISSFAGWVADIPGSVSATGRFGTGALAMLTVGLLLVTLMTTTPFRIAGLAALTIGFALAMRQERPVLILDATGETAMVRQADGRLALLGRKRPTFAIQQWLTGDGDLRAPRDPALAAHQTCDTLGCTTSLADGRSIALTLDRTGFEEDCVRATIIITPLAAPLWCRDRAEIYDRDFFRTHGATTITLRGDSLHHDVHRNARYDRPWHPAVPSARPPATTPPATTAAPAPDLPARTPWDPDSDPQ